MAKAYSYVRFSSAKQAAGDSLRRQMEKSIAYAQKHSLELSDLSYRDLGVSGYDRSNIERGALKAFIDAVEAGTVAEGSLLLVEQFDRLSRAKVSVALQLLLSLVNSGIKVVTLIDEKIWDKTSINEVSELVASIIYMSRAHNESYSKAGRLSEVWGQKKKAAVESLTVMTLECPRWLTAKRDRSGFDVLTDKANSIAKVFAARIQGFGIAAITRKANQEAWPCPGKGDEWHTSLVGRLLNNRAVLGEYQPHKLSDRRRIPEPDFGPVRGFYPQIIDERTFSLAQAVSERRPQFPGRRDVNYKNFLQGLLRCSCGRSFVRKNKQSAKQPGYARYYCSGRYTGATDCLALGSKTLETAILNAVVSYAPERFVMDERAVELRQKIELLEVEFKNAARRTERFAEAIADSSSPVRPLVVKLEEAEAAGRVFGENLRKARVELAELELGDTDDVLSSLIRLARDASSVEERAELRENLGRVLASCVVFAREGYLQISFRGQEDLSIAVPLTLEAALPGAPMPANLDTAPNGFYWGTS